MSRSRTEKKKKWSTKKKIWISILTIFLVLIGISGVFAFNIYSKLNDTYEPLSREKSEKREEKVSLSKGDSISVLLLGIDQRGNETARSDSMIVMTVNPDTNTSKMVSIPRDTYVSIVGKGFNDKINHAHAFGGPEMAVKTVENFLNIPIDYYATINMRGFAEAVDLVGGITVNSKFSFTHEGVTIPKGEITLTSKNVLNYVRMRYDDPQGDFGRQERQRQVIEALAKKSMSFASLTKINSYMDVLGSNVSTNVPTTQGVTLINKYASAGTNTETLMLKGSGGNRKGDRGTAYYWDADPASVKEVSTVLRQHLGLEK